MKKPRTVSAAAVKPAHRRWSIYQIRSKVLYLGSVIASDQTSAIRKAIDEFQIAPSLHNRLMAQLKA
jgi:hypothetical protein